MRKTKTRRITRGQREFDEFLVKHQGDNILAPPITDKEALEILFDHFAPDYISVNPMPQSQVNTEIVCFILSHYKGKQEEKS